MKRIPKFLLIFFIPLMLAACGPAKAAVQPLVGLPKDAQNLILMLVTAAVTAGAAWLFAKFKIDFGGYVEPLSLALAGVLVTLAEAGLAMIPPVFDNIVLAVIHALVLILGAGLTIVLVRKARAGQTRSLLSAK